MGSQNKTYWFERVLKPGGRLLLTLATREYTGQDEFDGEMEFLVRRLPYSHDWPEVALGKLQAAGRAGPVATDGRTVARGPGVRRTAGPVPVRQRLAAGPDGGVSGVSRPAAGRP